MTTELAVVQDSTVKLEILEGLYNELIYSDPEVGVVYSRQALKLARLLKSSESEVKALLSISWVYASLEYYRVATDICLQAKEICEEKDFKLLLSNCFNNLGMIAYGMENYDSSIVNFEKSVEIRLAIGNVNKLAGGYNNIGRVLIEMKAFGKAKPIIKKSIGLSKKYDQTRWALMGLGNLAEIALEEKEFDSVVFYLDEAEALAKDNFPDTEQWFLRLKASRERQIGNPDKARKMLFELQEKMAEDGEFIESWKPFMELAELEESVGNIGQANKYLHKVLKQKDSLYKINRSEQMAAALQFNRITLKEKEEEFRLEQSVQKQKGELAEAKLTSWIYLMGAAFLLVIVFVFFLRNREQRKLSRRLRNEFDDQTQELLKANEELNTFIYQSSHYLRGPISTIQGLHKLMLIGGIEEGRVAELLGQKVEQLDKGQRSLVYTMELRNRHIKVEPVAILKAVNASIERISTHQRSDRVAFKIEVDKDLVFDTDAWVFGLILDHLLENAVVYSSADRPAWCRVDASLTPGGLRVIIEDNGIGMGTDVQKKANKMFYRGDHINAGNGLGLYNVQMGLEEIEGEIRFQGEVGKGTQIQLDFAHLKNS